MSFNLYDQSVLLILSQFSTDKAISIKEALDGITLDQKCSLSLAVRPVSTYILDEMIHPNYLQEQEKNKYVLTEKGLSARVIFERDCSQQESIILTA